MDEGEEGGRPRFDDDHPASGSQHPARLVQDPDEIVRQALQMVKPSLDHQDVPGPIGKGQGATVGDVTPRAPPVLLEQSPGEVHPLESTESE